MPSSIFFKNEFFEDVDMSYSSDRTDISFNTSLDADRFFRLYEKNMDDYIYREYDQGGIQEYEKFKIGSISSRYYMDSEKCKWSILNGLTFTIICINSTGISTHHNNKNPSVEFLQTRSEVLQIKRNISLKNILE
jgi:hypothetical protein